MIYLNFTSVFLLSLQKCLFRFPQHVYPLLTLEQTNVPADDHGYFGMAFHFPQMAFNDGATRVVQVSAIESAGEWGGGEGRGGEGSRGSLNTRGRI